MSRGLRLLLLLLISTATLILPIANAQAHSFLEDASPAPNSVQPSAPAAVTLVFGELVRTEPGAIKVLDPAGNRVDVHQLADRENTVTTALQPELGVGTYLVRWRVTSRDNHVITGDYLFSIGTRGPPPNPSTASASPWPNRLLTSAQRSSQGALVLAIGAFALIAIGVLSLENTRTRAAILIYATVAVLASGLEFLAYGPDLAGVTMHRSLDPGLLASTFDARFGELRIARVLILSVGVVLVCRGLIRLPDQLARAVAGCGAGALALSLGFGGHAAAAASPWPSILIDSVHAAAASCWVGGLITLAVLTLRSTRHDADWSRFSTLAANAVILVVSTGVLRAISEVGSWRALLDTTYGRLLIAKLIVFGGLLVAANLVRRRAHLSGAPNAAGFRLIRLEAFLGLTVIALTTSLAGSAPAKTALQEPYRYERANGPLRVALKVDPAKVGPNTIDVRILDSARRPIDGGEVSAAIALPSDAIAPIPILLLPAADGVSGHYTAAGWSITVPASWTLTVTVRTPQGTLYDFLYFVPVR